MSRSSSEISQLNGGRIRSGVGEQILRDARKPVGSKGIEPGLFNRIEQVRGVPVVRLMPLMNRGVMETPLKDDAIGKRTQATVSRRVRLDEQSVGVVDGDQRASAGGHGPGLSMIGLRHP